MNNHYLILVYSSHRWGVLRASANKVTSKTYLYSGVVVGVLLWLNNQYYT